jgi:hypothetical protein
MNLKIKIPEGYEIENFDKQTGEVSFRERPKDVTERIRTFDDVLSELGIKKKEFKSNLGGLTIDEIAYRKAKLIAAALNEGWLPDWGNSDQVKYLPWFDMGGSSGSGFAYYVYDLWYADSLCGSRLCFRTRELAKYAGERFTDIYKDFMLIQNSTNGEQDKNV